MRIERARFQDEKIQGMQFFRDLKLLFFEDCEVNFGDFIENGDESKLGYTTISNKDVLTVHGQIGKDSNFNGE